MNIFDKVVAILKGTFSFRNEGDMKRTKVSTHFDSWFNR